MKYLGVTLDCSDVIDAGVRMEWSNDGELLAVAGYMRLPDQDCRNELRFYRRSSKLQLSLVLPTQVSHTSVPVDSLIKYFLSHVGPSLISISLAANQTLACAA